MIQEDYVSFLTVKLLKENGFDEPCFRYTESRKGLALPIVGYTEHLEIGRDWIVRGNSIRKWLCDNMKDTDYQYAIADDDCDMLLEQARHFVRIDPETGVTDGNIEEINRILNSDIL